MTHELEIGHIHNRGHLLSDGLDTAMVSSQLNQLSRDQLPQIVVNQLDALFTDTQLDGKVYRINKLHLSFSLIKQDLHTQAAGNIFAQQFIQALSQALLNDIGNTDNIKCYANHNEYMGTLISDLLKGTAWRQWQYAEFSSLHYIETEEAAVQLLLARSSCLVPLIRVIEQQQTLPLLQNVITHQRAQMLFEQWAEIRINEIFSAHFLFDTSDWSQALSGLSSESATPDEGFTRAVIKAFIQCMAKCTQQPQKLSIVLIFIAQSTFVLKHKELISQWLNTEEQPTTQSSTEVKHFDADEHKIARHLLAFIGQSHTHALYVDKIIAISGIENQSDKEKSQTHDNPPSQSTQYIDCAHAGVALLVPVIVSIGLPDYFSTNMIRRALLSIAHADGNNPEYHWLQWLFPDDEDLGTDYPHSLPASTQLGLDKEQRAELARLNDQPNQQLARLITTQFAIRLSGLQHRRSAYLNQQFLHISGSVQKDRFGIQVSLSPIALNIVLSMSGFSPWQQTLPWLKKTLSIEVRI